MRVFALFLFVFALSAQLVGQDAGSKIITGSVLLNDKIAPESSRLLEALKQTWKLPVDSVNISDKTIVFSVPGATVMIATLDYPVSPAEIEAPALISWLWKTAPQETARHQGQVVISVIGDEKKAIELYKVFTRVAGGVLETSNSCGVFMGAQYLVVSKGQYLSSAHNMVQSNSIPLYCWIYLGFLQKDGKNCGYTYGMHEFGLLEMEILSTTHALADVHSTMYDAAVSVLDRNIVLKEGMIYDGVSYTPLPVTIQPSALIKNEANVIRFDY